METTVHKRPKIINVETRLQMIETTVHKRPKIINVETKGKCTARRP